MDVDTREDSMQDFMIVKRMPQLAKEFESTHYVQDCVGTSKMRFPNDHTERTYYYCVRTQSEYTDGSGMNHGLVGAAATKGELISNAWKYNYRVYIKTADRWIELTKDGPRELLENEVMFMTKEQYEEGKRLSDEYETAAEVAQQEWSELSAEEKAERRAIEAAEDLGIAKHSSLSDQEQQEQDMLEAKREADYLNAERKSRLQQVDAVGGIIG